MAEAPAGPSRDELEERWKEAVDVLGERPRDPELLVKAGQLSEQLDRRAEAYTYFHKALTLDPSKSFLVSKLRGLAVTDKQKEDVTRISKQPTSFAASLPDIFKYPLRGKGLPILIMGALLLWLSRALAAHSIGPWGLVIAGAVAAYMAMFYIDVCHSTVGGDDQLPEWPDPLRLNEFGADIGKFVGATFVSFLPVLAIFIWLISSAPSADDDEFRVVHKPDWTPSVATPKDDDEGDAPAPAPPPAASPATAEVSKDAARVMFGLIAMGIFGIVGLIYLPMATLANVVMGSPFACFNFPFVFRSIGATGRSYLLCLACYFGVWAIAIGVEVVVKLTGVIVFTGFGIALIELYGMTMLMRLLGLFYRMNQARLGWMAD